MLVLLLPMASICAHCSLLGCRSLVPVDVYQMCCLSAGFQRASLFAVCENLVRTIILDLKFNLVPLSIMSIVSVKLWYVMLWYKMFVFVWHYNNVEPLCSTRPFVHILPYCLSLIFSFVLFLGSYWTSGSTGRTGQKRIWRSPRSNWPTRSAWTAC